MRRCRTVIRTPTPHQPLYSQLHYHPWHALYHLLAHSPAA